MNDEELFHLALEKPVAERSAFLGDSCGGDAALRKRVEDLLHSHEHPQSFMQSPVVGLESDLTLVPPILLTPPGAVIGRYKILEAIGEGGYGAVFMAEQTTPVHRKVALKLIKPGMDSRKIIARFEAERQALALMDHPNIAKVFDAGVTDTGRPYFVMELVKGEPITKYCDEHRIEPRQRLDLFMQVCQAVQHAHQKGIIHRDLKPNNVLVAQYDGKPVPKVIDFGVAKATGQRLTEHTMFTGFGDVIGTLEYMSPEQAEVNQLDIDTRSDVYSLGVLLYELLTGTTPLENKSIKKAALLEMLRLVREEEPPKPSMRLSTTEQLPSISANRGMEPRKLSALVHGELDWIVMKALEKDRGRRYETATGLAADVQRYLADEAVHACPPSAGYRFRKFARRNKRSLIAAALLALALMLGSVVSTWQAFRAATAEALAQMRLQSENRLRHEADEARLNAERQTALASRERDAARRHLHAAQLNLAAAAIERGDPGTTIRILERQREEGSVGLRGFGWHYLWAVCHDGHQLTLRGHSDAVRSVKFVKDSTRLVSGSTDGTVKLWDTATAGVRFTLTPGNVCCTAVSPDGNIIAAGSGDGTVSLWNASTGTPMNSSHRHQSKVQCVAFSPDGKLIASCDASKQAFLKSVGEIVICETATGREVARHPEAGKSIAFSPDGATLAVTAGWGGMRLLDVSSWKLRRQLPHWLPVTDVAFSSDGKSVTSGNQEGEVKLWDVATGELQTTFRGGNADIVTCVAFSADGTRVACGREGGTVDLWEISSGRLRSRAHGSTIRSVAFSADGACLASGSDDGAVILWDATSLPEPRNSDAHSSRIWSLTFSPDGRLLASASEDSIKVWDVVTGQVRAGTNTTGGQYATFSPDGRMLASSGDRVRLWDAATVQPIGVFDSNAYSVAFSPDGNSLASGGSDAIVRIWDVATKSQRAALSGHSDFVWSVDYSADGKQLVSAAMSGGVKIWDPTSGALLRSIPEAAYFAKFSRDGATLETRRLAASFDVLIWDLATNTARTAVPNTVSGVGRNVAFSANGSSLVAGRYGFIREVDAATGEELVVLPNDGGRCWAIAFSSDGRTVVSGSWTGKVRFWRAATEHEVMQQGVELKSGRDPSTRPAEDKP